MNRNSNLSPLPFYETIEEQSFRKSYAYGIVFPLLAPKNRFLPFQIVSPVLQLPSLAEPEGTASSLKVTLCNFDGSVTMDITTAMVEAGLVVKSFDEDGYRVISFPGIVDKDIWKEFGLDFNNDFSMADFGGQYTSGEGRGYLVVEYEGNTWYSDVMTLVGDLSGCLKIEWYSYTDIVYKGGRIAYEGIPYANIMYVRQEIGKPTYDFSDEGEDRNGEYFATKQISEKTYHFTFLATEPVCDALRIASLSDMVLVTDQYGRQYQCDTFLPTPSWQGVGYLAAVDCEFQCDTMVVQASKVVEPSMMTPRFFMDGEERTGTPIIHGAADFVLYVIPDLPGLRLVARESEDITLTRLHETAYRVQVPAVTAHSLKRITAVSDYASASFSIRMDA